MQSNIVNLIKISGYTDELFKVNFGSELFSIIEPTDLVVIKPNWVRESHLHKQEDWDYVISHPKIITAIIIKVLERLQRGGKIVIADSPETSASFSKILSYYPVKTWHDLSSRKGVDIEIIDLRDDEFTVDEGIVISRKKLPGDPLCNTEVNLIGQLSEFYGYNVSDRGYYGADYNREETNKVHDGYNNIYRVSKTVISCDVFINVPKLKTHKKAGITCCLKNLVGINTYKNYLPHHSEGGPSEGGDQYDKDSFQSKIEGNLLAFVKNHLLQSPVTVKYFKVFFRLGEKIFGKTEEVVRSGNWYGNNTIWRTIIDLNKILLYSNPDGKMRNNEWINAKKYIGIVDAILAGEGNGPMAPDAVQMGYIISGTNPVAIDAVCAKLMGFEPMKIPSIKNSFTVTSFKLTNFRYSDIKITIDNEIFNIDYIPNKFIRKFKPHFGWVNHIESK
jgi:uncharacterized protein (DUF362 family)